MLSTAVPHDHIQGVMGLTLFEDFIYWTDGKSKSLRRAHKTTGANAVELLNSWQAIKSIIVYHPLRQPEGTNVFILNIIFVKYAPNMNDSFQPPFHSPQASVSGGQWWL